jgi:hypothetical protein
MSLFTQHAEWANACIQYFSHTYKACVKMCPHCIDDQPRRRFSITGLSGACTSRVKGWKQSHQCMDVFALCECARGCWSVNTQTEEKEDARTTQTSAAIIVRKIFILGMYYGWLLGGAMHSYNVIYWPSGKVLKFTKNRSRLHSLFRRHAFNKQLTLRPFISFWSAALAVCGK